LPLNTITTDANAFRDAVRDVKPLAANTAGPPASQSPSRGRVLRKAAAPALHDLDEAMP
jgi:hypothetical protein